ncbi:MAG: prephenate dehydratase [Acidiferrobacteraceae bacterium]
MAAVKKRAARGRGGLKALREQIDSVDIRIQELVTRRAELVQRVAAVKMAEPGARATFYRPEREAEVLKEVRRRHRGPLPAGEMVRLFREIMSACLALEGPLKVAFLGPRGTYTEQAVLKHFGHSISALPVAGIDSVFQAVESGDASFGIVPVENSSEGAVSHTLDRFVQSPLRICGEVELRVRHCLLGRASTRVKTVAAHPQALAQCRGWLERHLPKADLRSMPSNAEAAQLAAARRDTAAIAARSAAALYGLKVLAANIEDQPDNTTRFLVIGEQDAPPSGDDKTTLLVSTSNRPGALAALLVPLARRRISLSRIESRPSRQGRWEYVFFIDIEGHKSERRIAQAITELERRAAFCKWLGSYPRACP